MPDWLISRSAVTVVAYSPDVEALTLQASGRPSKVAFGVVPAGASITVNASSHHTMVVVELERQSANVSWRFNLIGPGGVDLPAALQSVTVGRASDRTRGPINIRWERKSGHLVLETAPFEISVGPTGDGLYSAEHLVSNSKQPLKLQGPGRCRRLTAGEPGVSVIQNPAPDLEIDAPGGEIEVNGSPIVARATGASRLRFTGTVTGELDIAVDEVQFNKDLLASGSITAKRVSVAGRMAGSEQRRLGCEVSQSLWCRDGTDRVDITLAADDFVVPHVLVGTQSSELRLHLPSGRISTPLEPRPERIVPNVPDDPQHRPLPEATLVDTMFSGAGSVELACSAVDVAFVDVRQLVSASTVTLSRSSSPEANGAVKLSAEEVFVAGVLDFNGSLAQVKTRLHARAIANGNVLPPSDGARLAVVTNHARDCPRVDAVVVSVSGDGVETAVVNSAVYASSRCFIGGPVDDHSRLELGGDAVLCGDIGHECTVDWKPSPAASTSESTTLRVEAKVGTLAVAPSPERLGTAELVIAGGGRIERVLAGRDMTVVGDTGGAPPVSALEIASRVAVRISGSVGTIAETNVGDDCAIMFGAADQARSGLCQLGLHATDDTSALVLDSGNGTIRVVPAPARPDGTRPASPRLVLEPGRYDIAANVPVIKSRSGVWLDVLEGGRVDCLSGDFSTNQIAGRVQGSRSSQASRAVLLAWPHLYKAPATGHDLPDVGVYVGRKGQLIDVDISILPSTDVESLKALEVLSPSARPLINRAKGLGPKGHGKLRAYRNLKPAGRPTLASLKTTAAQGGPKVHDNVRAEAQRLREIAEVVRVRAVAGNTYSAAQWAAAHAHALQVTWFRGERFLRWLHRGVGYGVRPLPALATYFTWTLGVAGYLTWQDSPCVANGGFRCPSGGTYSFCDNLWRAILLPGGVLRTDVGGAEGYHPIANHPMAHFVFVLVTGVVIGFVAVATKNYLLRPRNDA